MTCGGRLTFSQNVRSLAFIVFECRHFEEMDGPGYIGSVKKSIYIIGNKYIVLFILFNISLFPCSDEEKTKSIKFALFISILTSRIGVAS